MLPTQGTRSSSQAIRVVSVLVVLALATACRVPLREVGRAPEGDVRERESAASRAERARREDARHDRRDAEEAAATPGSAPGVATPTVATTTGTAPRLPAGRVETPAAENARTGTASTRRFHVAGCPDLEAAPAADRILFVSYWDAVDGDYSPCTRCKPRP